MELLNYASILLGVIASLGGGIAWYRAIVRKSYAAERDFNHIRNSISQLSNAIEKEQEFTEEQLSRLSHKLETMSLTLNKIEIYLLAKLGDSTIGRDRG